MIWQFGIALLIIASMYFVMWIVYEWIDKQEDMKQRQLRRKREKEKRNVR